MSIPGIDLIAMFLAGALAAVIGTWLWLSKDHARPIKRAQLSLHRKLLFISANSLLLGLLILAVAEWARDSVWEKTLRDIGGAFLAAAIIGYIIELVEVREYFKMLVAEFVTGMGFLRNLSSEDLLRHGRLSLNEMVGRTVGDHEYASSLVQSILNAALPHLQSVYRENYNVRMKLHVIASGTELEKVLNEIWHRDIVVKDFSGPVYMVETAYSYSLFRSREQQRAYNATFWVESRTIEDLPLELHVRCSVRIGDQTKDLALTSSKKGLLHQFSGEYEVPQGQPRVGVEVQTWQLDASRSTFTMQMISLTKGLTLTFSSKHDVYPTLDLFGLHGEKSNVRSDDPNVVTFARPDFLMLPGHGFSVSWSPVDLTVPRKVVLASRTGSGSTPRPAVDRAVASAPALAIGETKNST